MAEPAPEGFGPAQSGQDRFPRTHLPRTSNLGQRAGAMGWTTSRPCVAAATVASQTGMTLISANPSSVISRDWCTST